MTQFPLATRPSVRRQRAASFAGRVILLAGPRRAGLRGIIVNVEWSYADIMSTVAALSALVGALVAGIGGMRTNRKVDILTGRVDEHGRMLQTIVSAMLNPPTPPAAAAPPAVQPSAVATAAAPGSSGLPHG